MKFCSYKWLICAFPNWVGSVPVRLLKERSLFKFDYLRAKEWKICFTSTLNNPIPLIELKSFLQVLLKTKPYLILKLRSRKKGKKKYTSESPFEVLIRYKSLHLAHKNQFQLSNPNSLSKLMSCKNPTIFLGQQDLTHLFQQINKKEKKKESKEKKRYQEKGKKENMIIPREQVVSCFLWKRKKEKNNEPLFFREANQIEPNQVRV